MKKIMSILIFLLCTVNLFAEIKISIFQHMKFEEMNTRSIKNRIIGTGILEIQADEEDYGKIIELTFVEKGLMTNGKNRLDIEKFIVEKEYEDSFIIDRKTTKIKFYGIVDKGELDRKSITQADMVQGEYVGALPIMISVYEKEENNKGSK